MRISRDFYNLQRFQLGLTFCTLQRNVSDIMFLYDILNAFIDSSELLSMIRFT